MSEWTPRVREIINVVSAHYGFGSAEILGKRRTKSLAHARIMAMHLAREEDRWSYPELGAFFRRDHTTIYSAHKAATAMRANNPVFRKDYHALREVLYGESVQRLSPAVPSLPPSRKCEAPGEVALELVTDTRTIGAA